MVFMLRLSSTDWCHWLFPIWVGLFGWFSNTFDGVAMCTAVVCAATLIAFHFHYCQPPSFTRTWVLIFKNSTPLQLSERFFQFCTVFHESVIAKWIYLEDLIDIKFLMWQNNFLVNTERAWIEFNSTGIIWNEPLSLEEWMWNYLIIAQIRYAISEQKHILQNIEQL